MTEQEIENLIRAGLACESLVVTGDGHHFQAMIVSAAFEGKRPVARQQMVMATVQPQIASGELHALSLKTLTPAEANQA